MFITSAAWAVDREFGYISSFVELPLAHFCMPLDSLWLTFGCLGRPLASLVNALGLLWAWLGPGREK